MGIYQKVETSMREWMPDYVETTFASIKKGLEEEQDYVDLFFGPPGKGKSNMAFLDALLKTRFVNEILGVKRKFSVKDQTAWIGEAYITLFTEPAEQFSHLLKKDSKDNIQELIEKSRGRLFWLDEAKDLNVLEFLGQFNRTFSGILATCRALQFFYNLCLDSPTKLIPSIRDYRINKAQFIFITPKKHKFKDGKIRHTRACAMYGRKEFNRVVFSEPKIVRRSLNTPMTFIRKFPPFVTESIPLFPAGKMWNEYKRLKYGNMGQIILNELGKLGVIEDSQLVTLPVAAKILNMKPKNLWWAIGKGGVPVQMKGSYMKLSLSWVKETMITLNLDNEDETKIYKWTKERENHTQKLGLRYVVLDKKVILVNELHEDAEYVSIMNKEFNPNKEKVGKKTQCPKCKHSWKYKGSKTKKEYIICTKCKYHGRLERFLS